MNDVSVIQEPESAGVTTQKAPPTGSLRLDRLTRWAVIEIAAIVVVGIVYALPLLNLDSFSWPKGNESSLIIGLNQAVLQGLQQGYLPLWDRSAGVGFPLIANPDVSLYTPLVFIPSLLFGAVNGMKLGLALSFIVAGTGGWFLAWTLGLKQWGRVWAGLVWMLSGSLVNTLDSGIYMLTLGAVWMPWIFGSFILILNTDWKWTRILAVVSMFSLVMAGHIYFPLFALTGVLLIFILWAFDLTMPAKSSIYLLARRFIEAVVVLAIVGGLGAFTLLPQAQVRSRLIYVTEDPETLNWRYAFLNYVVDKVDYFNSGIMTTSGGHQLENYHYIGLLPFLLLLFVIPAFLNSQMGGRQFIFLIGLIAVGLVWADPDQLRPDYFNAIFPPFQWLRYPYRAIILGTLSLAVLSGFSVDFILNKLDHWQQTRGNLVTLTLTRDSQTQLPLFAWTKLLILFSLAGGIFTTIYKSNQPFIATTPADQRPAQLLSWLQNYAATNEAYFISFEVSWWNYDIYRWNALMLNASALVPFKAVSDIANSLTFTPSPTYYYQGGDPPVSGAEMIHDFGEGKLYRNPQGMPYAFRANLTDLIGQDQARFPELVTAVPAIWRNGNELELVTTSPGNERLVAFVQYYPGWEVWIDGQRGQLLGTGEYISVDTQAGTHTYQFIFRPSLFYIGVAASIVSLLIVLIYAFLPAGRWPLFGRRQPILQSQEKQA